MSAQIEAMPGGIGHGFPWTRWVLAAAIIAVMAAGSAAYVALRADQRTGTPKPAATSSVIPNSSISPADLGDAKPLEPVRKPVGRYVGEYPVFGTTSGAGIAPATLPVDDSPAGQSTTYEPPCRGLIRQPC